MRPPVAAKQEPKVPDTAERGCAALGDSRHNIDNVQFIDRNNQ